MARTRSSRPLERIVPLGYIGLAIALGALLLPSILRPPQDLQNTTAAFSPDAPPEETPPEALLQSLRQASSSTAGAKVEQQVEEVVIEEVVVEQGPPPKKKATVAGCYGDPPRQTESLYSALCVPAWTDGDNGGDTWRGVTKDEIKIVIGVPMSSAIQEGKLGRDPGPDDQETERVLKVWQAYFNERFVFYGRYLQLYIVKVDSTDEDLARAAVSGAVKEAFAYLGHGAATNAAATGQAIKEKVITFAFENNPVDFYADNHPYVYGFDIDSWQTRSIGPEVACKHFVGKPPGDLNNEMDLTFDYGAPRKWGLIVYQDEIRTGARAMYEKAMAKCGATFEEVAEYNLNDDPNKIAEAMAKMQAARVTTVMLGIDPLTPGVLAYQAQSSGYFPEYLCVTGCSANATGRLLNDVQAEHFLSLGYDEIPRADEDKDWYRAYKEIDPEGEPEPDWFRNLQQLSGAIQHAGTNLNPDAFWKGLRSQPCRTPEPRWSMGGCYADPNPKSDVHYRGDYSYIDYGSLMWFDNAGDDPNSTSAGAWCYMNMGARYLYGEYPTEPLPFREPEQCIFTPPRGEQG